MGDPLQIVPADDYEQAVRLAEFRERHPGVLIGPLGFDHWQGRIPQQNGETVVTRRTLPGLLATLGELLA